MGADAETIRRRTRAILASDAGRRLTDNRNLEPVRVDWGLAKLIDAPRLSTALAINYSPGLTDRVNGYGYAVGCAEDWKGAAAGRNFLGEGSLSDKFRTAEFAATLSGPVKAAHLLLSDGLKTVCASEADRAETDRRIIVKCNDVFFVRVQRGLWVQKKAQYPVSLRFGSQDIIVDIHLAITECLQKNSYVNQSFGFYEVPWRTIPTKTKLPPVYGHAEVEGFGRIFAHQINRGSRRSIDAARNEIQALRLLGHPRIQQLLALTKKGGARGERPTKVGDRSLQSDVARRLDRSGWSLGPN